MFSIEKFIELKIERPQTDSKLRLRSLNEQLGRDGYFTKYQSSGVRLP